MRVKLFVVTAVLMIAGIAEAGLSKAAQQWRRGPEKFIMSDDEERAWKALPSDEAAAAFIDLFWARRDPTAGTPRNEFRKSSSRASALPKDRSRKSERAAPSPSAVRSTSSSDRRKPARARP